MAYQYGQQKPKEKEWWETALEIGMTTVGMGAGFLAGGPGGAAAMAGLAAGGGAGKMLAGPTIDAIKDEPQTMIGAAYGSQGALSAPPQQVAQMRGQQGPPIAPSMDPVEEYLRMVYGRQGRA